MSTLTHSLRWDPTEWPQIGDLIKELEPYASLWQIAYDLSIKNELWMNGNTQVRFVWEEILCERTLSIVWIYV